MINKTLKNWFSIPALWLGTWKMWWHPDVEFAPDQKYIDDIRRSIDIWITLIDTAEIYADWHCEELVWKAIKNYSRRDLFIISKVFKNHLHYEDLIKALENTLDRLWTDYLDLYLIHAPNPEIDIKETMEAMNFLYDKWLIKNIGVSNFKKETLEIAQSFSNAKIVLNQCHYNLIFREPEISWLNEYCQNNDIIMQAWRPLQYWEIASPQNDILKSLSQKYSKTYSQIALNRLISQCNITTLTKMSTADHIKENLWSIGWEMEPEDIELLKKNYPNQKIYSSSYPLG